MINTDLNSTSSYQTVNKTTTGTDTANSENSSFYNLLSSNTTTSNTEQNTLNIDTSKKPNMKELMDFTGISAKEASSILYGVIGSNEDTRDWNKILTSSDVLKAAKEETAKMYNSNSDYSLVSNSEETASTEETFSISDSEIEDSNSVTTLVDIQEGNLRFKQTSQFDEETQSDVVTNSLYLASSNGNLLRNAGNTPAQIVENLDAFGFDIEPLSTLAQNEQVPSDIKNLINETISYYNTLLNNIASNLTSTQSYSTLDLFSNNLNVVDNS